MRVIDGVGGLQLVVIMGRGTKSIENHWSTTRAILPALWSQWSNKVRWE